MTFKNKTMRRSKRSPKISINDPPAHNAAVVVNHTFRFQSMSGTAGTISLQSLLAACGSVTTVLNTQGTKIADTVKINSIKVWSEAVVGNKITLAWESNSSLFTRPVIHSDTCTSTSQPAHIFARPPKNELFSDWICASSVAADTNVAIITTAPGSIVDVNLSFQLYSGSSNVTSSTVTYISGAAPLGSVFYGYLDTSATHIYVPVDLVANF